jgi:hypothetical protein
MNPINAPSKLFKISFNVILYSTRRFPNIHLGYTDMNLTPQPFGKGNIARSRNGWTDSAYSSVIFKAQRLDTMYRFQVRLLQMKNKLNVASVAESLYRVMQKERIIF